MIFQLSLRGLPIRKRTVNGSAGSVKAALEAKFVRVFVIRDFSLRKCVTTTSLFNGKPKAMAGNLQISVAFGLPENEEIQIVSCYTLRRV